MLPSALSRERIVSLGACGAFSIQPVLPSVWRPVVALKSGTWPKRLTQSPELGFGFCLFSSGNDFDFVLPFVFAVEPFHLSRYVDEQVFRYNNRGTKDNPLKDSDRFKLAMSEVLGRRLTYRDLTGRSDSPHHETTGTGKTVSEPF